MADDKPKFIGKILQFRNGRLCFTKTLHVAGVPTGKNGKQRANAKAQHNWEVVLDPSNKDHAATIAEIKAEAKRALDTLFGTATWDPQKPELGGWSMQMPNFHSCFGLGNDLPKLGKKIYDGYKDMFYIKMKRFEEDGPPLLANRRGALVTVGQPECPVSGGYVNGRFTLWAYDNESKGINCTGRSLQFLSPGKGFGGGGALSAEEEFEALGDVESGAGDAGDGAPAKDPFDI